MIIIRDANGVTVKRAIDDGDHVRYGVFDCTYWASGVRLTSRPLQKPHDELSINDMLDDLQAMEHKAMAIFLYRQR